MPVSIAFENGARERACCFTVSVDSSILAALAVFGYPAVAPTPSLRAPRRYAAGKAVEERE
jgi:hypothetical protein